MPAAVVTIEVTPPTRKIWALPPLIIPAGNHDFRNMPQRVTELLMDSGLTVQLPRASR